MDPAELRLKNFIRARAVPVHDQDRLGLRLRRLRAGAAQGAWRSPATTSCAREQAEKRARGELMGIGVSFFTEAVGAGPRKHMDILGLGMADGAELRVHPTGKAVARGSRVQTQGQGHETTFAQIVAEELGIPPEDIEVVHGDTDQTPFGLGTYGSRSTPVSRRGGGAGRAQGPRQGAARSPPAMLEVSPGRPRVGEGPLVRQGRPRAGRDDPGDRDGARTARSTLPEGVEGGLDAEVAYDPPNLTFPFGAYICVVDVDPGTGEVKVRRFVAVDDCGTRINPMIIEGQIHGGLDRRRRHGADGDHRASTRTATASAARSWTT